MISERAEITDYKYTDLVFTTHLCSLQHRIRHKSRLYWVKSEMVKVPNDLHYDPIIRSLNSQIHHLEKGLCTIISPTYIKLSNLKNNSFLFNGCLYGVCAKK